MGKSDSSRNNELRVALREPISRERRSEVKASNNEPVKKQIKLDYYYQLSLIILVEMRSDGG